MSFRHIAIGLVVFALVPAWVSARRASTTRATAPSSRGWQSATQPAARDVARHESFLAVAKQGNVGLLFLGDSITDQWRSRGRAVWQKSFAAMSPANFGVSGDRTQHVLWRIQNGELDGIKPKVVVLMIGTNNLGANSEDEIAGGITVVVREISRRLPDSKVLLLGIFPRGSADRPVREWIKRINQRIARLDDGGKTVRYLDIGDRFIGKDGSISPEIMPDGLHLSPKGYEIEAEAILPAIKQLMGQ